MCGRYVLEGPIDRIAEHFEASATKGYEWADSYNIAPTTQIPVVRVNSQGQRVVLPHTWGLIPFWAKDATISAKLNNARGETVHEKPAFRKGFARFRCLIPATGYYEWQAPTEGNKGRKIPHYIHPSSDKTRYFAMAGVCDHWKAPDGNLVLSTAIITTSPHESITHIHDRMPVMIAHEHWQQWLDPNFNDLASLREHLHATGNLSAYAVGFEVSQVGAKRQDNPLLIQPISNT